jgi:DNA polymerase, archaea type
MDLVKGAIVTSAKGIAREVKGLIDGNIVIAGADGTLKAVPREMVASAVHPNPRKAATTRKGAIEVELDRLSLDYEPTTPIPPWQPKTDLEPWESLTKLYLDIETMGLDAQNDRVLMVGLMDAKGQKTIISSPDERALLLDVMAFLGANKPRCLIGHNLVNFDLPFLMRRCQQLGIRHPFKAAPKPSRITSSSFLGRPIEFTPIRWQRTDILDTFQQIAIWDKSAAKLDGYGLKNAVLALGLRADRRLELGVNDIRRCWESGDLATVKTYLEFDLDDTQLLADFLLPIAYYQMAYVPRLTFQTLAIASPALKAQKVHQALIGGEPVADEPVGYAGGGVELVAPGLHSDVAKIDVASLYPSIMLKYGLCSRKDPQHKFLGWLRYLKEERIRLKALAANGDYGAKFQQNALKILINGSYGFLGTGGYGFNDFEAAALVTAYGRKILSLMTRTVEECGGQPIELDTDGILFSHPEPQVVHRAVTMALPEGIEIELELSGAGLYAPKAKSYVIVHLSGKTTVKGLFRKRNRSWLESTFPVEYVRLYFTESPEAADRFYSVTKEQIADGSINIGKLAVTRKIASSEKSLVNLGLGQPGESVTFWQCEEVRFHKTTRRRLRSIPKPTNTEPYWPEHYLKVIDEIEASIRGMNPHPQVLAGSLGLKLTQR